MLIWPSLSSPFQLLYGSVPRFCQEGRTFTIFVLHDQAPSRSPSPSHLISTTTTLRLKLVVCPASFASRCCACFESSFRRVPAFCKYLVSRHLVSLCFPRVPLRAPRSGGGGEQRARSNPGGGRSDEALHSFQSFWEILVVTSASLPRLDSPAHTINIHKSIFFYGFGALGFIDLARGARDFIARLPTAPVP